MQCILIIIMWWSLRGDFDLDEVDRNNIVTESLSKSAQIIYFVVKCALELPLLIEHLHYFLHSFIRIAINFFYCYKKTL